MDLPATWDLETDVCVLGSGATALTSAILAADGGCDVAILEKADFVGGTSAISGGVLWIPNHHHMAELGIPDSREDAIDYLESLALGVMDMELVETFVDEAPQMVRYLEEHTPAKWHIFDDYPDYHPEHIGGKPGGGRSLDNDLFPFAELGAWRNAVNTVNPPFPATLTEAYVDGGASLADALLAERRKTDMRGSGQALVGALLKGCLDREIPIRTAMRARDLLVVDDAIVGVRAEHNGTDFYVKARKAVVLGTGGFEWNGDLVKAFLRGPMNGPCSPPENEGDGLLMAMSVGAALGNMSEAWWIPSFRIPGQTVRGKPYHQICLMERTWPGSIIVNSSGRRFTNEAANYNAIGRAFHTFDASSFGFPNLPAWIVFDNVYKEKYRIIDRIVRRANSLRELAKLIQVDADGLEATVARFNTYAVKGEDPDFHRGESVYDSFNGDRSFPAPFTTLGTLDAPPFYAVEVLSGVLGTKGGPKTNTRSQALDTKGRVIRGLYAVGNAMAGTTGMVYGGAGGTLGPGMTYGYIAGINAAKEPNHIK